MRSRAVTMSTGIRPRDRRCHTVRPHHHIDRMPRRPPAIADGRGEIRFILNHHQARPRTCRFGIVSKS